MVAFGRFNTMATKGEENLRSLAEKAANMTGQMGQIEQQTGAPAPINAAEIPAVAALANLQASVGRSSTQRETAAKALTARMPKYVSSYRNYLKWRYPNVYGGGKGKGGGLTPVTGGMTPAQIIPDLPSLGSAPIYGGGQ